MLKTLLSALILTASGTCLAYSHDGYPNSTNFNYQVVHGDREHNDYLDHYSEDLYRIRYRGNHWYTDERYYYYYDDFDPAVNRMNHPSIDFRR